MSSVREATFDLMRKLKLTTGVRQPRLDGRNIPRRFSGLYIYPRAPGSVGIGVGADVARADGWQEAIALAEKLQAPVYAPPASERCGFPEDHPQFAGTLPFAIGPLGDKLAGHDLMPVVGAPVFRDYPYVPGRYLREGCGLLHITDSHEEAAAHRSGTAWRPMPNWRFLGCSQAFRGRAEFSSGRARALRVRRERRGAG